MLEFMLLHTPRNLLERFILKIVGPIIRISNYPLMQRQKLRIMELIISILDQKFKVEAYRNQLLSVCLRLLQEFRSNDDVVESVANVFFSMLMNTVMKKEIVIALLGKLRAVGSNLIIAFYYLTKKIIKEGLELPKNLFEKMLEEINAMLLH